ncbi:MAG: RuvX/YqgF family protein [Candidatus Taylorbacteria bacterium]|nr:RuvX/YqgF family protein [Candidatus Taylorbacteria bacterium]
MKYMGIDFGSKRVGISVSDDGGEMAFPKVVLKNSSGVKGSKGAGASNALIKEIKEICLSEKIGEVVIGESKNYKGEKNKIMDEIMPFAKKLKVETGLTIHLHPEFMTSAQAVQIQGENEMLDASAATIILQAFLDKKKNL